MAYVSLEDPSGTMELIVFSRVLEESRGYLQVNTPILAAGRLSVREDQPPQLLCDRVTPLSQVPDGTPTRPQVQSGTLFLRLPSQDSPLLQRIKNLFLLFPGQSRAILCFADSKRRLGARCLLHDALLDELRELLDAENVVVQ